MPKHRKIKPGTPVYVIWQDSHRADGWDEDLPDGSESLLMESVGWLLADLPDRLAITTTIGTKNYLSVLQIPKVAVEQYRPIDGLHGIKI